MEIDCGLVCVSAKQFAIKIVVPLRVGHGWRRGRNRGKCIYSVAEEINCYKMQNFAVKHSFDLFCV